MTDDFDDALALANGAASLTAVTDPRHVTDPAPGAAHGHPAATGNPVATPWAEARARAAASGGPSGVTHQLPLADALGHTLADPLPALTDLPAFDTSAMDGWAVAGPGPWALDEDGPGVLAGDSPARLPDGHAVAIATGARIPQGATAVLRTEHGFAGGGRLTAPATPPQGADIRPRGQECRTGDLLLPAGTPVTPAVLGLAAAAGYDRLTLTRRPRAHLLVLGDELLSEGAPADGRVRDALGPMVGPWLAALGADVTAVRHLGDSAEALHAALTRADAGGDDSPGAEPDTGTEPDAAGPDLVVTTGSTAAGPVDHLHATLKRLGARLLVDGVAVRPGHPMLLAALPGGTHLVGLPGNPLAAVSALLTLAAPLVRTLADRDPASGDPDPARLSERVQGHPTDTRLVPVTVGAGTARPLRFHGPAMLRGIASADALAVIPPGGAGAGAPVHLLGLPRN
ncbi:molybdopterin molybdotransferase MoeA [Streptomyces sp. JJ66]|uniref:molybdopterin molybdotransferase MoeA n=1 Tax=Streptomyces sp. JJ66 TaxID=2803843 RepID=UPI001C59FCF8|nr:molybdopterin molybdotransferase MoeA [Streptomyces sp. JJ66]MBW1602355.1 molybdopterin molybdotransferase MoeA [Streptomyces sp. JJ66]